MKYRIELTSYSTRAQGLASYDRPETILLVCTSLGNTTLWQRWWYKLRYGLFPLSWDPAQPLGEAEL